MEFKNDFKYQNEVNSSRMFDSDNNFSLQQS